MGAKLSQNSKFKVSFEKILTKVKSELHQNPFDAGHDFLHHEEVFENVVAIVKGENLIVDMAALSVASWLHDYERNDEEARDKYLRQIVSESDVPADFAQKVIRIMSSHSYGEVQESEEQKVLFDADKLEYLSVPRFIRVMDAITRGEMTEEIWSKYKKAWKDRIPRVRGLLHYDTSRKLFDERIGPLLSFIKSDQRLVELRGIMI